MIIAESHNDYLIEAKPNSKDIEKYIDFLVQSNVKLINFAFFSTHTHNFNINKILNKKDLVLKTIKGKNLETVFSIEDMQFFNMKNIDDLIALSPTCCSLTWNYLNQYAGGAKTNHGITNTGKDLIASLQNNHIFVDTAHLSKKSFYEFLDLNTQPILNTHCGFAQIKNHFRNIDDDQIKQILQSNGYIGIAFVKDFYDKRKIFNAHYLAKCICNICSQYGTNNFGIGSDFYGTKNLPIDIKNYNDFAILKNELTQYGMSNTEIDKIFYYNFYNFLKRNKKLDNKT